MALVVEDGTSKADAESYISVEAASTYHADRGNAAWAALASDTVREQMLRRATDYLTETYRTLWAGVRTTATQALDWPRCNVPMRDAPGWGAYEALYPNNEVPQAIARACAELALRAASGDLLADLKAPVTREKVGPIERDYAPGARQTKRYPVIDGLLSPFLQGGGMSIPVLRA